jgi:adenylate kinase
MTATRPVTALILFGPPGSGKGTQARLLEACLNTPHISTGDMLREHIRAEDEIGLAVRAGMKSGHLVPDELVNRLVDLRIAEPDCARGFILDGYPRTTAQADAMARLFAERRIAPLVAYLKVDYNEVITRLSGRRQCPVCGTLYSMVSKPPKTPGICDNDGAGLITREDDSEPVIRLRLEEYEAQTRPLLDYFRRAGVPTYEVDGSEGGPRAIAARICGLVAEVDRQG